MIEFHKGRFYFIGGKLDLATYFEDIVIIKDSDPYFCSAPQAISLLFE